MPYVLVRNMLDAGWYIQKQYRSRNVPEYGHVTRYARKSDFARQSSVDHADFPKHHVDSTSNDDTIDTTTSTFILIVNYQKLQNG